jgi:hypothetical protein
VHVIICVEDLNGGAHKNWNSLWVHEACSQTFYQLGLCQTPCQLDLVKPSINFDDNDFYNIPNIYIKLLFIMNL